MESMLVKPFRAKLQDGGIFLTGAHLNLKFLSHTDYLGAERFLHHELASSSPVYSPKGGWNCLR